LNAPDDERVTAEYARVYGPFRTEPRDGLLPGQVKKRIRTAMWRHHNYIKTEETMRTALDELRRIEEEDVPRMRLQTDTTRFNYDWVDALDAVDMLRALQLEVQFCLYRQESRGAFYREDYPNTDNENWLVHVVGRKGADGDLALEKVPVDLPYARPDEAFASFFDVDY
jgi:succinate dehydrogenase / fumarate reductase flavoprotein subunit